MNDAIYPERDEQKECFVFLFDVYGFGNWFSLRDLIGMEFLVTLDLLGNFLNIVFDYNIF